MNEHLGGNPFNLQAMGIYFKLLSCICICISPAALPVLVISLLVLVVEGLSHPVQLEKKDKHENKEKTRQMGEQRKEK